MARRFRFRPSAAEWAVVVAVVGSGIGALLLPSVIVEPYRDALAHEDAESLKRRVGDAELAAELRERALLHFQEKAGTDAALTLIFSLIDSPETAQSPMGRRFLAVAARHPRPALAGEVLAAWENGRLPDDVWRHERVGFLANGWGPVCGWIAVPAVPRTKPTDRRMAWIADVLAHGDETPIRVPWTDESEPLLAYRPTPRIFFDLAEKHFIEVPPSRLMPELELRYLHNLRPLPAYLGSRIRDLLARLVASRRLPALSATDDLRARYAAAVFAAYQRFLSPDEFAAKAASIAADPAQADAYGPFAVHHATATTTPR